MGTNRPRVLLVEDDDAIREAVASVLRAEGYVALARCDGLTLRAELAGFRPDLVILDVRLPHGPSGLSLARMVRDSTDLPVLMLSAADAVRDRLAGFGAGADDYLTKPFAMPELLARVHALLQRCGRLTSSTWQVGDLVVDEGARQVCRGSTPLELTQTEFDLLVALGRHRDRVLSKSQLLVSVWGFEEYDDNVVEARISSLRRKLEQHGPRMIHTERGCGYRLRSLV